jgi:hypothetical protein
LHGRRPLAFALMDDSGESAGDGGRVATIRRHPYPRLFEDPLRVETLLADQIAVVTGSIADDRLVGFEMELETPGKAAEAECFSFPLAPGEQACARWQLEGEGMPVEDIDSLREAPEKGVVARGRRQPELTPPNFRPRQPRNDEPSTSARSSPPRQSPTVGIVEPTALASSSRSCASHG